MLMQVQGRLTTCPSAMAASESIVVRGVFSAMNRTEPSPKTKLQPPECKLPGQDQLPTLPSTGAWVLLGSGGFVQGDIQTLIPPECIAGDGSTPICTQPR